MLLAGQVRKISYPTCRSAGNYYVSAWEVTDQMITICSQKYEIAKCTQVIDGSIAETSFPISKESPATLVTKEWKEELKQINEVNDFVYRVDANKTSTVVTVVALDNEVSGVVSRVKAFLKSQLDIDSETFDNPSVFHNLYNLNSKLAGKLIDQIAEGLSVYHVILKPVPGWSYSTYTVSGTKEGKERAKKHIAKLDSSF